MKCDICGANENVDNTIVEERQTTFCGHYIGCTACTQKLSFHLARCEQGRVYCRISNQIDMLDISRSFTRDEYIVLLDKRHEAYLALIKEYERYLSEEIEKYRSEDNNGERDIDGSDWRN